MSLDPLLGAARERRQAQSASVFGTPEPSTTASGEPPATSPAPDDAAMRLAAARAAGLPDHLASRLEGADPDALAADAAAFARDIDSAAVVGAPPIARVPAGPQGLPASSTKPAGQQFDDLVRSDEVAQGLRAAGAVKLGTWPSSL